MAINDHQARCRNLNSDLMLIIDDFEAISSLLDFVFLLADINISRAPLLYTVTKNKELRELNGEVVVERCRSSKSERKMQDSESDKEMQDGEDILAKPLVTIEDVIHIKPAPWWTPMDFMARVGSVVRVKLEEREKLVEERVKNMNPSATDSVPDHSKSERKMQDSGKEMQDGKDIPAKPLVTIEDVIGIKPEPWWTPMDYMAIVASVAGFKLENRRSWKKKE
ncbi:unnamed protein product [Ilex paraguariensis]|uniref:Uncharacterized protein n=1 Tax=Ilex paraguariensis TaxID=185542 RepID=A0ABC8RI06_9AQUA